MRILPIAEPAEPLLLPDMVWDGETGDLAIDLARSDLQCAAAIETAVIICLMTDRRVEPSELPEGESNRGWPGDAFDLLPGEVPLGSKLWLLRRRALTGPDGASIEILAADYAREALQTLIDQGVAVRAEVSATRDETCNRLDLDVALYGRDGAQIYHRRFDDLWRQIDGGL